LIWELVLALTVGIGILTVPWVAWCGRRRVARRRLGALLVLTLAVSGLLGLLVVAAAYVDNTNHPVPWPIATVAMFLPLGLLATRIAGSGRRVAMIAVTNLAVGAVVLDAARRCVDDDCLPLPLPYSLAGVGGLWFIVTELAPFGTFPGDREARSATRRVRLSPIRRVRISLIALVVVIAAVLFVRSDANSPECDEIARTVRTLDRARVGTSLDDVVTLQTIDTELLALRARATEIGC
jgi:hypothetical protein